MVIWRKFRRTSKGDKSVSYIKRSFKDEKTEQFAKKLERPGTSSTAETSISTNRAEVLIARPENELQRSNEEEKVQQGTQLNQGAPSNVENAYPGCERVIKQAFQMKQVSAETADVMFSSLTNSTKKQYDCGLKKWWEFCSLENIDPFRGSIQNILSFLTNEYKNGMSYGSLNSFRSAIALIYGTNLAEDDRVKRFFKGASKLRPSKPKYNTTWDPKIVLDFISKWGPNSDLNLGKLSSKIAILLALVTGHRLQTLISIDIRNIKESDNGIEIKIPDQIKTSKINRPQPTLFLPYYTENSLICPVLSLKEYLERTSSLRGENKQFLLSFKKPYNPITTQTLSRWVKDVMTKSGINTEVFSAYSTRHAATSAAHRGGINIDTILKTAGWTEKSNTFAKFYKRDVVDDRNLFALSVLE
ncbi:uncharacterized protein LOC122512464 isoform X1 [Leptopilina heterotoma]|uniref:uncharacterized protein LOC122510523 isoform X1 n=1 Tax=Leptopilina heterotoma TaxID=63436 RepID=UPI001CA97823|nr:uncharacterized protein LOC122510523 isoform X1 [Leptopilina heterotoma]XP_043484238.1 uncharacterized protein LOC122512464 isoform X1 [Leptopilina heterotoma]